MCLLTLFTSEMIRLTNDLIVCVLHLQFGLEKWNEIEFRRLQNNLL